MADSYKKEAVKFLAKPENLIFAKEIAAMFPEARERFRKNIIDEVKPKIESRMEAAGLFEKSYLERGKVPLKKYEFWEWIAVLPRGLDLNIAQVALWVTFDSYGPIYGLMKNVAGGIETLPESAVLDKILSELTASGYDYDDFGCWRYLPENLDSEEDETIFWRYYLENENALDELAGGFVDLVRKSLDPLVRLHKELGVVDPK